MACKCKNVVPIEETRDGETIWVCNQCREEVTKKPTPKGKNEDDE